MATGCNAPSPLTDLTRYSLFWEASGHGSGEYGIRGLCEGIEEGARICVVNNINGGVCTPKGCQNETVFESDGPWKEFLSLLTPSLIPFLLSDEKVQLECGTDNALSFNIDSRDNSNALIVLLVICIFAFLMVFATILLRFPFSSNTQKVDEETGLEESLLSINSSSPFPSSSSSSEEKPWLNENRPLWQRVVLCFSVEHNWSALITPRPTPRDGFDPFASLDGARVLSMAMVILGHAVLLMLSFGIINITDALPPHGFFAQPSYQPIQGAEFAVDAFFLMSAFLATTAVVPSLQKAVASSWFKGIKTGLFVLLHRYVRLVPTLAATLVLFRFFLPALGRGPMWFGTAHTYERVGGERPSGYNCDKWWWTNILFVNNLVPFKDNFESECAGWTWYLANDWQFLVFLVVLSLSFARMPKWALPVALCVLCVGSLTAATYYAARDFLVPFSLAPAPRGHPNTARGDYSTFYYVRPYFRFPAYAIGILFGLGWIFIAGPNGPKSRPSSDFISSIPWWATSSLIFCGAVVISVLMYIPATIYDPNPPPFYLDPTYLSYKPNSQWTHAGETFYTAFSKPIFCIGLCFVLGPGVVGKKNIVNSFLSWSAWQPLSKLTYSAYLIHIPILVMLYGSRESGFFFNGYLIPVMFLSTWMLAYTAATVLTLSIEKPFMNLESVVLPRKK